MLALWITESGKSKGQSSVEEYPLMKKILRIVCGNADAFHSRMKLLCCGRHGEATRRPVCLFQSGCGCR